MNIENRPGWKELHIPSGLRKGEKYIKKWRGGRRGESSGTCIRRDSKILKGGQNLDNCAYHWFEKGTSPVR